MKASQSQGVIAALLAANVDVAPFAPFILEDDVTNNEKPIDAALEAKGACIAIDEMEGAEVDSAGDTERALALGQISLVIYEQPQVAHTPARLVLIEAVVNTVISGGDFKLKGFTRFKREKGGVAAVVDFTAMVFFG